MNTPQREVADHALAILGAFLGDYTDPDEDGHCARVVVLPGGGVDAGYFDVEVHRAVPGKSYAGSARFRVSVMVAPAPYPVNLSDESSRRGGVPSRDESGVVRLVSGAGHRA